MEFSLIIYIDMLSAKSFIEQWTSRTMSLMKIRKTKGSNIDPWGIPEFIRTIFEDFPFNTIFVFCLKYSLWYFLVYLNCKVDASAKLYQRPWYYRKTVLISFPTSRARAISSDGYIYWLIVESPFVNPDCLGLISLLETM